MWMMKKTHDSAVASPDPDPAAILESPSKAVGISYLSTPLKVIDGRLILETDSPKTINRATHILKDSNIVYDSLRCRVCGVPWDDSPAAADTGHKHSIMSPDCPGRSPVVDPSRLLASP